MTNPQTEARAIARELEHYIAAAQDGLSKVPRGLLSSIATALAAKDAELAEVKEMYAREGAKALYELERAARAEHQLAEANRRNEELERERDGWFQATKNALEAGTIVPAPEPTRKTSQRDDWHYDSDGYCDNPGRGY